MEIGAMSKREREEMLVKAAIEGNLRLVKKMARALDKGQGEAAVITATAASDGKTALHAAAMEGQMDVLKYLVEDLHLDLNPRGTKGETPLFFSATFGRTAATRYLLDHGANPELVGSSGSPLHSAAGRGHCEIVELLLSRGTPVDLPAICGTPLHTAAFLCQPSTLKILLNHHADPNKVTGADDTALVNAIRMKSLECVKLLIKAGADATFIDSNGYTSVRTAVDYGTPAILKCVIDAGANPNIPDEFGTTPIEVAALHGTKEVVEILFPLTSPISSIPEWSIDGIISRINTFGLKPWDKHICKKKRASLKVRAADAFKRMEYLVAGQLYANVMELFPSDAECATVLANRSICWLRMDNGKRALDDANACRMMRPNWPKAYYRQGAAFMLLKDYEKASEAFADALKLDSANVEIENALRECREAMENARCAEM